MVFDTLSVRILLVASLFLAMESLRAQKNMTVAFYNVENFFDTVDDPQTQDQEYLPDSPYKWDQTKYQNKIKRISQVIDSTAAGAELPDVVGFCEIENNQVLKDLVSKSTLKSKKYATLSSTGLDTRGINVGFIFNKSIFDFVSSEELNATNASLPNYKTRNILFVTLKLKATSDIVYFFVNHWPSRRDGESATESKRIYAAQILRKKISELQKQNAQAKIIVMGDLNDTPNNRSVLKILSANGNPKKESNELLNPYFELQTKKLGSHYHEGEWNLFDNIIVSQGLLASKGLMYKTGNAFILKKDFVLFKNYKTGEEKPNRTFGGNKKYFNGYSDHLAVYIKLYY
jgi:predicted extracellular nuclease